MKIKIFLLLFLFNFKPLTSIYADALKTCNGNVSILHDVLISNNKSDQNLESRFGQVQKELNNVFDYYKMIKIIYGSNWKNISQDQRNQLSKIFLKYISFNYSKRFHDINNLKFEILSTEELNENVIIIRTNLIRLDNQNLAISYICSKQNNLIFDVLIQDSISEISTKKSEFRKTIQNEGPTGLIQAINKIIKVN